VFFEILYTVTIVSVIDELNIGHLRYLKLFLHTGISSACCCCVVFLSQMLLKTEMEDDKKNKRETKIFKTC